MGGPFSVGEYEDRAAGFEAASYDPGMVTNYEKLFTVLNADPGWKGGTGGDFNTRHVRQKACRVNEDPKLTESIVS